MNDGEAAPAGGAGPDTAGAAPDAADTQPAAFRFRHRVDVRFRDLDPMGHAHHSLVLIYIEEARAAYWREIVGRRSLEQIDYILADIAVSFQRRIFFPGTVDVGVRVTRLGRSSFVMEYALWSESGAALATARTVQVMYDYAAARPQPISDDVRQRIETFEARG